MTRLPFMIALVAAAFAAGLWLGRADPEGPPTADQVEPQPPAPAATEARVIEVFEARRDSVVSIATASLGRAPFSARIVERAEGAGSGFVWDAAGHIVTNDHVIAGADRATVALADGRSFDARLVGRSPAHDLAVLRIDARDLPAPLPRASGAPAVGQTALAIGNPFGLDWTLTTGIVSATDRDLPGRQGRTIRGLIQTDAAINPGNSGGPLLDAGGRLIGVNTAIFSPSGASAGIGFAVPVATVERVVPQLIARGRYDPPVFGIRFDGAVNAAARRQGLEGLLVLGTLPDSPAARAGLEPARPVAGGRLVPGDIVIAVDGRPVRGVDDYLAVLDRLAPGREVEVRLRNGRSERVVPMAPVAGR